MIRLFLISVWLTACTNVTPTPIAYHCPIIILPSDPVAPVTALTDQSPPDAIIKAWVATAVAYHDWNRIVREQIEKSR